MKRLPVVRLYDESDADLIEWLGTLSRLPFGSKSATIKETLRRGLSLSPPLSQAAVKVSRETTTVNFDTTELLADVRRVVEAALSSALSPTRETEPVETQPVDFDFGNFLLGDDDDDDF